MSGLQVERCELQRIEKDRLTEIDGSEFDQNSNVVALEVLNDIVETALDSATSKEDQALRNFRMVGDIVDQYTPRATKITDLCDNSMEKKSEKHLTPAEEEVKKLIGEITSPSSKGTGDQLQENEEVITKKKSFPFSSRNFHLEKKTRLTDLVRTSKSLISKFLSNENTKSNEWEEKNEEFVNSVDFGSQPEDRLKVSVENGQALTSSNSEEMVKIPDERNMENINLKDFRDRGTDPGSGFEEIDYIQKSMTFPIASCSRIPESHCDTKEGKERKKWNLGSKIVDYIKKKTSRRDITKTEDQ
ncbi:hypothetical protein WA026_014423 [Henosepilachna vigintioctopunctata]|uniref:Uncharacterized protein n=1 Tax=Henosepilachna vigintioctopunctata TaxID=420089 RepID=A0AAW1UK53_9CUCU